MICGRNNGGVSQVSVRLCGAEWCFGRMRRRCTVNLVAFYLEFFGCKGR